MSDLTTKEGKKFEEEQERDKFYKPYKKYKQEGNDIDNYTAIFTSIFIVKPAKMRKFYAPFLKGFKDSRNNLKLDFRNHRLLYIQTAS